MTDMTIGEAVDETTDFLADLAEWERPSIASEAGRLLEMWAEHDAGHIADMEALREGRSARANAA